MSAAHAMLDFEPVGVAMRCCWKCCWHAHSSDWAGMCIWQLHACMAGSQSHGCHARCASTAESLMIELFPCMLGFCHHGMGKPALPLPAPAASHSHATAQSLKLSLARDTWITTAAAIHQGADTSVALTRLILNVTVMIGSTTRGLTNVATTWLSQPCQASSCKGHATLWHNLC